MKVAVISSTATVTPPRTYGGLEAICAYSAEALAEDHDVTLFAARGSSTCRAALFETIEPDFSLRGERQAWEVSKSALSSFDVVVDHSHRFESFRAKLQWPRLSVLKVFHGTIPARSPPPPNSYNVMAGVSQWHSTYLHDQWKVPIATLYNGIPINRFVWSDRKDDFLLFLSRLDPGKGAHHFVDLCASLGVRGIIAGNDDTRLGIQASYRDSIIQATQEHGLDYRGAVSEEEKIRLLTKARAVVVPLADQYREAFGIFIIEALASGTPVFTTDRGAPAELIAPGTGVVSPNIQSMQVSLRDFLDGRLSFDSRVCLEHAKRFDVGELGKRYRDTVLKMTEVPN